MRQWTFGSGGRPAGGGAGGGARGRRGPQAGSLGRGVATLCHMTGPGRTLKLNLHCWND